MLEMSKKEQITFVMVTHEPSLAACADRIITILDGRVQSDVVPPEEERIRRREALAAELAQRIGCDGVEYITVTPDTRKDMLLNGEVDVVIATYSIAESREENFDFSAPYYEDDTIIMVEKSTLFGSIRDLKDKNIGIVNGTNAGPLLAQKLYDEGIITDVVVENTDTFTQYEGAYVTKTERYEDLDALLETGEIDAACMDACIAQTYMNDQREFLDVSIAHQEYGVATVKDSAFSAPVAEAVQAMLDDGTIERLIDKWN